MSYLDLLKLASPEAIVVLTALVVLPIGLLTERAAAICAFVGALGLAIATGAVLMLPHYARLFYGVSGAVRKIPASSGRISGGYSFGNGRSHAARWQRRVTYDFHRARTARPLPLRDGCIRQDRCAIRGSRSEIFSVRQHLQRVHAFRNQFDLWHVREHRSRCDLGEIGGRAGATFACDRHYHDAHRLCVQDCCCAVSLVGA